MDCKPASPKGVAHAWLGRSQSSVDITWKWPGTDSSGLNKPLANQTTWTSSAGPKYPKHTNQPHRPRAHVAPCTGPPAAQLSFGTLQSCQPHQNAWSRILIFHAPAVGLTMAGPPTHHLLDAAAVVLLDCLKITTPTLSPTVSFASEQEHLVGQNDQSLEGEDGQLGPRWRGILG